MVVNARVIYMMVIWKKVWRDLWGRKWRSSQVVLSIAVGVFAIGLTLGMLDTVQEGMSRAWQSANPSQILIGVGDGVTDDVLHFISTMPDLEERHLRIWDHSWTLAHRTKGLWFRRRRSWCISSLVVPASMFSSVGSA